jgi:hypothetical protein
MKQNHQLVARSILKQFVYQLKYAKTRLSKPCGEIVQQIVKLYEKCKGGEAPEYPTILQLIGSCAKEFFSTFLFLDGLDECKDEQQNQIINLIRQLRICMRVFLTSQPQLSACVNELGDVVHKRINASDKDIEIYLRKTLAAQHNLDQADEEEIRECLKSGADGM